MNSLDAITVTTVAIDLGSITVEPITVSMLFQWRYLNATAASDLDIAIAKNFGATSRRGTKSKKL